MRFGTLRCVMVPVGVLLLAAGGCSSGGGVKVVSAASAERQASLLGQVKALEGTWVGKDENGAEIVMTTYQVTSKGSAVREVMFPGMPHEMTNLYHMDGDALVVTHYCAVGNQPRMRSVKSAPGRIEFGPDSVTNLTPGQTYMGGLTLVMADKNTLLQEWTSYKDGKVDSDHAPRFELKRKM